jgi:hypothetical protein
MTNPSTIFLGKLPSPILHGFGQILLNVKERFDKLYFPTVGEFGLAEVARKAGYNPEQIWTSDIALYSAVIWYYCQGLPYSQMVSELKLQVQEVPEWVKIRDACGESYEGLLLFMKCMQFNPAIFYEQQYTRELLAGAKRHGDRFRSELDEKAKTVAGVRFGFQDIIEVTRQVESDPNAILFLDPPTIKKGYDKMFEFGGAIQWDQPDIPHFDVKEGFRELMDIVSNAQAMCFVYGVERNEPFNEAAILAIEQKSGKIITIVTNRPEDIAPQLRRVYPYGGPKSKPGHYRQFGSRDEVRADSKFTLVPMKAEHALYYRNLWVHRLGVTAAKTYTGWFIDGKLAGVVGWHDDGLWHQKDPYIFEIFAISVPHEKNLNRLLIYQLACASFTRRAR